MISGSVAAFQSLANVNGIVPAVLEASNNGVTTFPMSGATTTLTSSSGPVIVATASTGTATELRMPLLSTCRIGQSFTVVNNTGASLDVRNNAGSVSIVGGCTAAVLYAGSSSEVDGWVFS